MPTTTTSTLFDAFRDAKISVNTGPLSPPISSYRSPEWGSTVKLQNVFRKTWEWLNRVGLKVNPFDELDASLDPLIPFYLVDHNQYRNIWGDFTSFVFAPPGSGKSAMRVRLARDCRTGKNGRKIFPVTHNLPNPEYISVFGLEAHYSQLARSAAQELLLYVLYHFSAIRRDKDLLREIRQSFDLNLPVNLLQQIADDGSMRPLLVSFDRTADLLPNPPSRNDVVSLVRELNKINYPPVAISGPKQRFEKIVQLVLEKMGFEAIYVLVDGVDGYVETANDASKGMETIRGLLQQNDEWQGAGIFTKYFLPSEMRAELQRAYPALLTSESKVTIIEWDADALSTVLKLRLQEASGGKYDSLRAISSLPLRGARQAPEEVLAGEIVKLGNPNPRDLIKTVRRLLLHHAQYEEQDKLTPTDMTAALDWIHQERSMKTRYA